MARQLKSPSICLLFVTAVTASPGRVEWRPAICRRPSGREISWC